MSLAICAAVFGGIQVIIAATGASAVHYKYDVYFGYDSAVSLTRNCSVKLESKQYIK